MKLNRQLANGKWVECGDRTDEFLKRAMEHKNISQNELTALLDDREQVSYGTDWNEKIVDAEAFEKYERDHEKKQVEIEMVKCSCGHTIPKNLVMSSSRGTCCPDCYDRMSE